MYGIEKLGYGVVVLIEVGIFVIGMFAIYYSMYKLNKPQKVPEDEYFQNGYDYYPNETNIPLIAIYSDMRAKSFLKGLKKARDEHIETKMLSMITIEGDVKE